MERRSVKGLLLHSEAKTAWTLEIGRALAPCDIECRQARNPAGWPVPAPWLLEAHPTQALERERLPGQQDAIIWVAVDALSRELGLNRGEQVRHGP